MFISSDTSSLCIQLKINIKQYIQQIGYDTLNIKFITNMNQFQSLDYSIQIQLRVYLSYIQQQVQSQKGIMTSASSASKALLERINRRLSNHNNSKSVNIWHSVFKWNYDHHLMKNLLKLLNKTLKGLNKYHVFKRTYTYTFVGMGLGYVCSTVQNTFDKVKNLQFQPAVADLIIENVLKNQQIRLKLQEAVNDNVLQNEDIQTNLHFILLNKVLIPQKDNLNILVKQALLSLLRSEQVFRLAQTKITQAIQQNKDTITSEAFKFFNSETMDDIIKNQLSPLIKGQMAQKIVSSQLVLFVTSQLHRQQNKQKVYEFLRQKLI